MARKKLAVVGNGMGTSRLLDELVQRGGHERYEITVFGEEMGGAYNRIALSRVLGGAIPDSNRHQDPRVVRHPRYPAPLRDAGAAYRHSPQERRG